MIGRVVCYYQYPFPRDFERHMIEETGLSPRDQEIVRNLRSRTCSTELYASMAGLPLKTYNEAAGRIHRRLMDELIRLAQIGYLAERSGS